MKTTIALSLLACFGMGCVAGPEDAATKENGKAVELPVVESDTASAIPQDDAERGEFQETASGLRYRILQEGADLKPLPHSLVTVQYRGWLDNGTEFDSSYRSGKPFSTPLSGVIPGWTEGLQLIGKGGKIELDIPSDLGYGDNGFPPVIPPNARLHFDIELLNVVH